MEQCFCELIKKKYFIDININEITTYKDIEEKGIDLDDLLIDIMKQIVFEKDEVYVNHLLYLVNINYIPAIQVLAYLYINGIFYETNYEEALHWYTKAAEKGDCESQFNLASMYRNGEGTKKDLDKAIYWYSKAFEQGDDEALNCIATIYLDEDIEIKDYKEIISLFEKAANLGNANAAYNLGIIYDKGLIGFQDLELAKKFYQQAAKKGCKEAKKKIKTLGM